MGNRDPIQLPSSLFFLCFVHKFYSHIIHENTKVIKNFSHLSKKTAKRFPNTSYPAIWILSAPFGICNDRSPLQRILSARCTIPFHAKSTLHTAEVLLHSMIQFKIPRIPDPITFAHSRFLQILSVLFISICTEQLILSSNFYLKLYGVFLYKVKHS